jgi:hypothetical protein
MRKTKIFMVLVLMFCVTVSVQATRFGGLYGTDSGNTRPPVAAFLDTVDNYAGHTRVGPTAHYIANWDSSNNAANTGVDDFQFTFTCEHGSPWAITTNNGTCNFNAYSFGSSNNYGWGDDQVNWIVLYSCQVIRSEIEVADWWSVWMSNNPYDVMDGVHMVLGFRTNAYVSPAVTVSTNYANEICTGGECLLKWFHSVWFFSYCQTSSYDKASAVFEPNSEDDTLTSYSSDPAPYILHSWYY